MKSKIKISILLLSLSWGINSCGLDLPTMLNAVTKNVKQDTSPSSPDKSPIPDKNTDTNKTETDEKVMIQQVRENIKTFKEIVEKYSEKNKDNYYPETVDALYTDANKKSYWKDIKNPFTSKSGTGISGSFIDMKEYKFYTTQSNLKGLVVYEALKCSDSTDICNYKLYGTDKTGALLE